MYLHENDYALLDITFKTGAGGTTSVQSSRVNLALESTWMPLSQTAVAPAGTTEVTLSAQLYHGDSWVSGRLYFDDFSAQATPAVPEPRVLSLIALFILLLFGWRRRGSAGLWVTLLGLSTVSQANAANLLINPGFATAPNPATDWTLSAGAARGTFPSTPFSHDGDGYVLRFYEDSTPASSWATASQTLAASPEQEWTFSAWAIYPSGMFLHEGDYGLLDITFRTASGATTSTQSSRVNLGLENTWQQLSKTAIAPANTTEVTFSAKFYHGDGWVSGRLYFDDFFADKVDPVPEPYVVWAVVPVIVLAIWRQRRLSSQRA
jgi:hypothetical protein